MYVYVYVLCVCGMPSDTIYVLSVAYFFMHIFMLLDEQLCGRIPRPDSVSA